MKKSGVLHAQLIRNIASLGHFDSFVLCDMGFPIPRGAEVVDLCLTRGLVSVRQALEAVLSETVVQDVVLVDGIAGANPDLERDLRARLCRQRFEYVPFDQFRRRAAEAKFFVRTAEDTPCANVLLVSASGVQERVDQYIL